MRRDHSGAARGSDQRDLPLSIQGQLLYRNVQRSGGGLVFKAHRLLYYSTLGLRVRKKKEEEEA